MANGEDQDLKEGIQKIRLLDGRMARRWQDVQRAPWELQENGCSDGPSEGQEVEGGDAGAEGEITNRIFSSRRSHIFVLGQTYLLSCPP